MQQQVMRVRQPIIAVLGHIDHGKTSFLDKVRGTSVAEKEAGKITQHIGATEVPARSLQKTAGGLLAKFGFSLEIPGLLFIDTPGHEAFTNLRKRGGSTADLAVVIVDVQQGFQPQTIEAIEILRNFKTPFIVGLNKLDKLHGYDSRPGSFSENLEQQDARTKALLDEKVYATVGKLHELGFESERFDRCTNFGKQVAIIPLSAHTGEGLPEMLALLSGLSQKFLRQKLAAHEEETGKGNVLEVKEEKGLGTTIDVILFSGTLRVNDTIALAGKQGLITTKIRALLKPRPLEELRETREKFSSVTEVMAAAGIKIAAPGLEPALAGSPLSVVRNGDEGAAIAQEVSALFTHTQAIGPVIKADTLGALEALTRLLEQDQKLKPHSLGIGEVTRKDVMEAISLKDEDTFSAVIFAFNVKQDEMAVQEARKNNIPIFAGNVIYHILEAFSRWVKEEREREKKDVLKGIVLPAKIVLLPNHVFRNSKPVVVGVKVVAGTLKPGVKLMNAEGKIVGRLSGIQSQNKSVEQAVSGEEVAVSISDAVFGRTLFEQDTLYTHIPGSQAAGIEAASEHFSAAEKNLLAEIREIIAHAVKEGNA